MYLFFAISLPIFIILICINHLRRKRIIRKICAMCMNDKCDLLNELVEPFGYYYISSQDIFTTRIDAWQREFGYGAFYDEASSHLGMIFDSLPIYFNYQGRTWLMEFWKGQYGINTGCEVGLYYTDHILKENELKTTLFASVKDADMVKMSFTLYRKDEVNAQLSAKHWWLTAFRMGCFSQPSDLSMRVSVTFPSPGMARSFTNGLINAGYSSKDICYHCGTVTFIFDHSSGISGIFHRMRIRLAEWSNRFWCRVFGFVTRPFHLSVDRVLYLYYYLPFAFRRMLRIRKYKRKTIRSNHLS